MELIPISQKGRLLHLFHCAPKKWGLEVRTGPKVCKPMHQTMTLPHGDTQVHHGQFLTSLDLTIVYFHIPSLPSHYRFLRLFMCLWDLQFRALLFGLSTAAQIFTKVLVSPEASFGCKEFMSIHAWIDNLLIKSNTRSSAIQITVEYLQRHGFLIDLSKSLITTPGASRYDHRHFLNVSFPHTRRN